jgi:Tfp pilus assembly protein PilZ
MSERRRTRRFQLGTLIEVLIQSKGRRKRGRLINLSEGGAFLAMRTDVEVGEELRVTLKFPLEAGGRLRTRMVVVWRNTRAAPAVRSLPTGCGVLFQGDDLQEQLRAALEVLREQGLLVEEEPPFGP